MTKRKVSNFLSLALLATGLISCESQEFGEDAGTEDVNAKFTTTINSSEQVFRRTRVVGNEWEKNDAVGIFAFNSGETLSGESLYNGYFNVEYVNSSSGFEADLIAVDEGIIYPTNNDELDFVAYYPYSNNISGYNLDIDIATQEPLSAIDVLYAKATNHNAENPNVNLSFKHQLSQLQLKLTAQENINLENASITIENTLLQGTMSLIDGSIANGDSIGILTPAANYNSDNNSIFASAIMIPNQDLDNVTIKVILADSSFYTWNPDPYELKQNVKRSYSLNLTPELVEMKSNNTSIWDWESDVDEEVKDINPGPNEDSSSDPEEPYPNQIETGSGTKDDPYSVARAIVRQGEDSVWVEGYIIGFAYRKDLVPTLMTDINHKDSDINIVLASDKSHDDMKMCLPVGLNPELPSKTALNLKDNYHLMMQKVKVLCDLDTYMSGRQRGGNNIIDFEILSSEE